MDIRFSRPPLLRPRVRVTANIEEQIHTDILALAGATDCSASDIINYCLAVGVSVMQKHPECIHTLKAKFNATVKLPEKW